MAEKDLLFSRYTVTSFNQFLDGKMTAFDKFSKIPVNIEQKTVPYSNESDYRKIVRELELCVKLFHKNICNILNAFTPQKNTHFTSFYIVYNFMDFPMSHLIENREWILPVNDGAKRLSFIMYQVFCAVDYLHKVGICHRDLRPQTILIDKKCRLKISEFGNACRENQSIELPSNPEFCGYCALEIFDEIKMQKENWTKEKKDINLFKPKIMAKFSADMWAVGITLCELVIGKRIFGNVSLETEDPSQFITNTVQNLFLTSENFPQSDRQMLKPNYGRELLLKLISTAPETQITVKQALNYEYVRFVRMEGEIITSVDPVSFDTDNATSMSVSEWKEKLFGIIKSFKEKNSSAEVAQFVPKPFLFPVLRYSYENETTSAENETEQEPPSRPRIANIRRHVRHESTSSDGFRVPDSSFDLFDGDSDYSDREMNNLVMQILPESRKFKVMASAPSNEAVNRKIMEFTEFIIDTETRNAKKEEEIVELRLRKHKAETERAERKNEKKQRLNAET